LNTPTVLCVLCTLVVVLLNEPSSTALLTTASQAFLTSTANTLVMKVLAKIVSIFDCGFAIVDLVRFHENLAAVVCGCMRVCAWTLSYCVIDLLPYYFVFTLRSITKISDHYILAIKLSVLSHSFAWIANLCLCSTC
jgi:hypothetical protein